MENDNTYVVLPADGVKSDGVDVLIEDEGEGDRKVENGETLGTQCERKNLDGVRDNERGECETDNAFSGNSLSRG